MNMRGLGTDIIEIQRIKEAIERQGERFTHRIFTQKEREYCKQSKIPYPHYAARFAAKEAISKALGTGFGEKLSWQDIEIINDANGKPEVHLKNGGSAQFLLSMSHCKEYATATAIYLTE